MDIAILFGLLFVLLALSVPIGISLGIATAITILTCSHLPLVLIAQNAFTGMDSFPMLAIPMAAAIGIAKKNVSREKATAQSLRFMSSFISLKNKLFDVISCHLRFTDKDLFQ